MQATYTPHPSLRPAVFPLDVLTYTTLAMRGGSEAEFGILYRTFQKCDVRAWVLEPGGAPAMLAAWVRIHPYALPRVLDGDITVLDELDPYTLAGGAVLVLCELWTAQPATVYPLGRALASEPGVEWLVGRRGPRWRAHRTGRKARWDSPSTTSP